MWPPDRIQSAIFALTITSDCRSASGGGGIQSTPTRCMHMNICRTPPREFMILSHARTGSTQLHEYLDQFPGTRCFGEVFRRELVKQPLWEETSQYFTSRSEAAALHRESALQFWLKLRDAVHIKHRRVGAKIFYYHREGESIWDYILNADIGIIHLTRRSLFASFVSLELANQTGIWSCNLPGRPHKPAATACAHAPTIRFDAARYIKHRDYIVQQNMMISARLASNPNVLNVEYNQISNTDYMSNILSGFLGVKADVRQTLLKQSPQGPLAHVINKQDAMPFADDMFPAVASSNV